MKKEFFWVDLIVIGILVLIGYLSDLEVTFLIGVGLVILGSYALISGNATIGNTCYYHNNKILGRLMGAFELLIGVVSFSMPP